MNARMILSFVGGVKNKKILSSVLVLMIASAASASYVTLLPIQEGQPGSATNPLNTSDIIDILVTTDTPLYALNPVLCITGGTGTGEIVGATNSSDCADYGWEPTLSIGPIISPDGQCVEFVEGIFFDPVNIGAVAYIRFLCTGQGTVIVKLSPGTYGSIDKNGNTPTIEGTLTIYQGSVQPPSAGWTEPVPVTEVNTEYCEWAPFLSFDGLTLYFSRGKGPGADYDFRIYEATRPEPYGPFTSVREISGTLNSSPGNVLSPWVSPDNLRMYYFTESNLVYKLKVTERASENDPWPVGINIPGLSTLGGRPQAPSLTADELIIVFSSYDAPGGVGGYDLWMATRPDRYSPFENVRNLTEINTAYKESKPYITPDGLALYFPSDRVEPGLYMATRGSLNEPFGNVEPLSFLGDPGGAGHPSLSSDGTTLYMIKAINGSEDIFVSYLVEDTVELVVMRIEDAIIEKIRVLERIDATLEKKLEAYQSLEELLESGDYEDLKKGDIVTAMQKIHSAIQLEELSKKALKQSIKKLLYSLSALGYGPQPPGSNWPPNVIITKPQNGAEFNPDQKIEIEADAWDYDGSVVMVEFYADGSKIGEDNDGADGWTINWYNHPEGTYSLTAKATDNEGTATTSTAVGIRVVEEPPPPGPGPVPPPPPPPIPPWPPPPPPVP